MSRAHHQGSQCNTKNLKNILRLFFFLLDPDPTMRQNKGRTNAHRSHVCVSLFFTSSVTAFPGLLTACPPHNHRPGIPGQLQRLHLHCWNLIRCNTGAVSPSHRSVFCAQNANTELLVLGLRRGNADRRRLALLADGHGQQSHRFV